MDLKKIYQNVTSAVIGIKEIKQCPYNCTFKGTRMELNEHMYDNAKDHIQSIIFEFEQKMIQMEENIINETRQSICDLSIEIDDLKKYIMFVPMTIPSAPSEIIYPICPFVWEISDFSTKLALAKNTRKLNYVSPPFYLFKEGYFASLKIYPNGDGAGLGKFLSVYITLRNGIYDDKLIWPFVSIISMRIIPGYGKWDEGYGCKFMGDGIQSAFQKPISVMNVGSGSPLFIQRDKLLNYLINDSLFIEIRHNELL